MQEPGLLIASFAFALRNHKLSLLNTCFMVLVVVMVNFVPDRVKTRLCNVINLGRSKPT